MEIGVYALQKINIKTVSVHVKVCDGGSYDLKDDKGNVIASKNEDYVPDLFPGQHYGDYLILDIDIETGVINNWKKIDEKIILSSFPSLLGKQED